MTVREQVLPLLARISGVPTDQIRDDHHVMADLGMDSVQAVEFLADASDLLGCDIDIDAATQIETVADCIALAEASCG